MKQYIFQEKIETHKPGGLELAEFKTYPGHIFDNGKEEDIENERLCVREFLTASQCASIPGEPPENPSALYESNVREFGYAIEAFKSHRKRAAVTQDAPAEDSQVVLDL